MGKKRSKSKRSKSGSKPKTTAPFSAVDERGEAFGKVVRDPRIGRGLLLGLPTALPPKQFRA